MLIKESTLRRIIREEARRALHEDDAAVPAPVAAPVAAPAPAKPPLTDPYAINTMINNKMRAFGGGPFLGVMSGLKNEYGHDEIEGRVQITWDILTTGRVDFNTLTIKVPGSSYEKNIEKALKPVFNQIRFDPIATPIVGREHAYSVYAGRI